MTPLETGPTDRMALRIVLNAVEGFGKSTCGAYAPNPVILMARGETGYLTLLAAKRVPEVPRVMIDRWPDLLARVRWLVDQPYQTVVLDALGGFERLCHEFVCERDFDGVWGEKGFTGWQRGYEISVPEWIILLEALDRLHAANKTVLILSHSRIGPFKNPMGPDFDRYVADCHHKTWGPTAKWADDILFGKFMEVTEEKKKGRIKGVGGQDRVLYTERHDAYDAKTRSGLPEAIWLPNDPTQSWATIEAAYRGEGSAE